jgi:hypothetical protein
MATAMGNLLLHMVLLSIPQAMFMLPIVVIIAFRNLTVTATLFPNGALMAATMDNFTVYGVLL